VIGVTLGTGAGGTAGGPYTLSVNLQGAVELKNGAGTVLWSGMVRLLVYRVVITLLCLCEVLHLLPKFFFFLFSSVAPLRTTSRTHFFYHE
jgi:hypothetical protein